MKQTTLLRSAIAAAAVTLATTAPAANLVGLWLFDNAANVGQATVGSDLTLAGTAPTHSASLADDASTSLTGVITTAGGVGTHLTAVNPIGANGAGGLYTNQFTLVYDIFSPAGSRSAWRSLLQTSVGNSNDGDYFIRNSDDTLGVSYLGYSPTADETQWMRLVVTFNLGTEVKAYVNGSLFHTHNTGAIDDRMSLDTTFHFFGDEDDENAPMNVGALALFDGPLTAGEVAALGRPGAAIPEPGMGLLALAGAGLGLRRRRK